MYKQPQANPDFYQLDEQILAWWKEKEILRKSILNRPADQIRAFYDGPITANGEPHHGHMLTFAMKDIIPRYWTMKGYRVHRSLGWDCQGIPVEYEVEKKLGFKEKKDIEKYGIAKFNQLCRESVQRYMGDIVELEEMMGRLTEHEEEYATMDKDYIESVWWSLQQLFDKGLLYEGFKVVPYSTRAGTTLSNAEVSLGGYKTIVDRAITVEFPLVENPNRRVLAWTTTPWTIPGNLGLAIGKEIDYVEVSVENETTKSYIVAEKLAEQIFKDKAYKVITKLTNDELIGKKYLPPFNYYQNHANSHQIFYGDHVTTESGTGIVHLAPYGAEDNDIFVRENISSFDYLDDQGDFTQTIPAYAGMNYRDANKKIVEDLIASDKLFAQADYAHEMPMCWRTKTPLIYKPIQSWYIAVSKFRDKLTANNDKINWTPDHVKQGRFGNWLAEIKDWGISRSRYWGTPLPVWKSESGKIKFIGSYAELAELSGVIVEDPHRPYIDDVTFEIDGEKYQRIQDVIDVWYDSGAMPFARLHYPFENADKFGANFPADYISESVDQTRGWFYSLHAIATLLFDKPAFNNVVMSGFVLDDEGSKLSKSKGNYTSPKPMIAAHGADAIRLNFYSTPISQGEDTTISDKTIKIQKQTVLIPWWNIYSYFVTYANLANWTPDSELVNVISDYSNDMSSLVNDPLDKWIVARIKQAIAEVSNELDTYQIPRATKVLGEVIDDISKWYIRRSRSRFAANDKATLDTLYYSLVTVAKLMAPFTPFISEKIYQELTDDLNLPESIHLTDYPSVNDADIEAAKELAAKMQIVRDICEAGNSIRTTNALKLRQPLAKISIAAQENSVELSDWMQDIIADELNIKNVVVGKFETGENIFSTNLTGFEIAIDANLTEDLKTEGAMRELLRQIQAQRKNIGLAVSDQIVLSLDPALESYTDLWSGYRDQIATTSKASSIEFAPHTESEANAFVFKWEDTNYICVLNKA